MLPVIILIAAVFAVIFAAEHFQNRKRPDGSASGKSNKQK